ncbi:MAG: YfcE family phosphodiesterase [Verrucomicrobia bacterium]|jgi:putative phosphoesterase|nr:YfcE family phosphodiesterase [Verrucomicrobiota bacterium]
MKIGILSDIHDQLPQLKKALVAIQETDALLCCGDLCSPFVIKALGEGYQKPIHVVFGNNDGDLFRITQNSKAYPQIQLHGELAELTFNDVRFGMNHFDNIARVLAESGRYDVVCFGHNHRFELTQTGDCQLINPGEVYGGLTGNSTLVIYNTDTKTPQRVDLPL